MLQVLHIQQAMLVSFPEQSQEWHRVNIGKFHLLFRVEQRDPLTLRLVGQLYMHIPVKLGQIIFT